ncbi:MAG: hypothetical protein PHN90_05780 [Methanothrix sp.]|nr:hypothetical protein [Methanothrix sp.]
MQVFIRNLHENASAVAQQLPRQKEPVPKIGKIGMNPQLPGVPEGLDHLGLLGEVLVFAVLHVPLVDEGLKIRTVPDAVRWIDVDHLDLAGHPLLLDEGVHHQEGVASDEAVGPVMLMLIEFDRLSKGRILPREVEEGLLPLLPVPLPDGSDYSLRIDPFVDVEGDGGDFEGGMLCLSGPIEIGSLELLQLCQRGLCSLQAFGAKAIFDDLLYLGAAGIKLEGWIDMRVVVIGLRLFLDIGLWSNKADWRVVEPGLVLMIVLINGFF